MDTFSYRSVLISIIRLGNDAGPGRRRRDAAGALASPALLVHAIWVTILYLASIVLFPPESSLDEFVNYKTHYYSNHRVFFVLFAVFSPVDFVDTLLKGISHLVASRRKRGCY
jgi:hypothetical protein